MRQYTLSQHTSLKEANRFASRPILQKVCSVCLTAGNTNQSFTLKATPRLQSSISGDLNKKSLTSTNRIQKEITEFLNGCLLSVALEKGLESVESYLERDKIITEIKNPIPSQETERMTFHLDESRKTRRQSGDIEPLDWDFVRTSICKYIYERGDMCRIAFEISAILLLCCGGLRPRQIFSLLWRNIKGDLTGQTQGFIQVGATTRHIQVSRYVDYARQLLIIYKQEGVQDSDPIFSFTPRTLERIVQRILGKEYSPMDASYLKKKIPEWTMDEFPLARSLQFLLRPLADDNESSSIPQEQEIRNFDLMKEFGNPRRK